MSTIFLCIDCGRNVFRSVEMYDNDQDICIDCLFLRSIEDPRKREFLKKFLKIPNKENMDDRST